MKQIVAAASLVALALMMLPVVGHAEKAQEPTVTTVFGYEKIPDDSQDTGYGYIFWQLRSDGAVRYCFVRNKIMKCGDWKTPGL